METFSALLAICAGNSPVPGDFPHKGQWRGALMFSLIYAGINHWVNNNEAGDLRRYRAHNDVIVMFSRKFLHGTSTTTTMLGYPQTILYSHIILLQFETCGFYAIYNGCAY